MIHHPSESPDLPGMIADLTARLQSAEQLLKAREATIFSLTHEGRRGEASEGDQEQPSEQGFASAFQDAPIGIALVSLDGKWQKVNPAFCELVGYSESELKGLTFQDITHRDDFDLDADVVRRLLAGEMRTYQIEKRYLHADGHVIPVLLNVSLARDPEGNPLYFIGHIQDITAGRAAKEKHRLEELRNLRQRSALIAFTKPSLGEDLAETIRRLTETGARTLGVARVSVWRYNADRSALRCVDLYELDSDRHCSGIELPASSYPRYFEALKGMDVIAAEDAHTDPRTSEFSTHYLRPLGINSMLDAPIHLGGIAEGVLCHEQVGPPRHWTTDEETFAVAVANRLSLALEASERQRVAEELQSTLAQLEQMLAHSPAVIFRLKVEGTHLSPISTSDNIAALLGYTAEETTAPGWWMEHLHPDDRERAFESMDKLMLHDAMRYECRIRHRDGSYRWIEDNQRLLRDPDGRPVETVGVWMDITERKEAEIRLESIRRELMEVSRQAGMAEVATSVLHNVGNVLNSVNISSSVVASKLGRFRVGSVGKVADLLQRHADDLPGFFSSDPAGGKLPDFLSNLAARLSEEQSEALRELELLDRNIDHIKVIVAMQQDYAKITGTAETVRIQDLVEDSLRLNGDSLARHGIKVVSDFSDVPPVRIQRHKVLQILVNLIQNAKDACNTSGRTDRQITLRVTRGEEWVRIAVIDNGTGIPEADLTRIFAHGFTTKPEGHGFGLHSGALAANEMGGRLMAGNNVPGPGATFTLELPASDQHPTHP